MPAKTFENLASFQVADGSRVCPAHADHESSEPGPRHPGAPPLFTWDDTWPRFGDRSATAANRRCGGSSAACGNKRPCDANPHSSPARMEPVIPSFGITLFVSRYFEIPIRLAHIWTCDVTLAYTLRCGPGTTSRIHHCVCWLPAPLRFHGSRWDVTIGSNRFSRGDTEEVHVVG